MGRESGTGNLLGALAATFALARLASAFHVLLVQRLLESVILCLQSCRLLSVGVVSNLGTSFGSATAAGTKHLHEEEVGLGCEEDGRDSIGDWLRAIRSSLDPAASQLCNSSPDMSVSSQELIDRDGFVTIQRVPVEFTNKAVRDLLRILEHADSAHFHGDTAPLQSFMQLPIRAD